MNKKVSGVKLAEKVYKVFQEVSNYALDVSSVEYTASVTGVSKKMVMDYVCVAKLPDEVKLWIGRKLPFRIALATARCYGSSSGKVLTLAEPRGLTLEAIHDAAREEGLTPLLLTPKSASPTKKGASSRKTKIFSKSPEYYRRIATNERSLRLTQMTRLICESLSDCIIAGTENFESKSFKVDMPIEFGVRLKELLQAEANFINLTDPESN